MKKLLMLSLMLIAVVSGCQQKQEPKGQAQYPVQYPGGQAPLNPMQAENDIKALRDLVMKEPRNVQAWINLGNTLMDTARFGEAADAYQKALDLDPKNVDVRVDMGTCYREIKRPDKAAEEYRKAISMNPNHVNAHRNLGVVLANDLKDTNGSIKELEKYLELAPAAPDAPEIRQMAASLKAKK